MQKKYSKNIFQKKNKIINNKLLNAFRKWKKVNNYYYKIKIKNNIIKKEINDDDIYENGGINKSKKIFIIYRKYTNYSYIMKKKILRKWKKIIEKNEEEEEKDLDDEKSDFDEKEDEEIEDYEEENEEENDEEIEKTE